MLVRYCTLCFMFHEEGSAHLTDAQRDEAQDHDVYHANETIYFSTEHMHEHGEKAAKTGGNA
jgi:hypothetical protein